MLVDFDEEDNWGSTFSMEEVLLWIMDLTRSNNLKLKMADLFLTNKKLFMSQLRCKLDWSHVDYLWIIVMFLSDVWTLILTAPIHFRGSTGEQVM